MRRIYIIPKTMSIEDAIAAAQEANCPEIVVGIPLALRDKIKEADLPAAYEEAVVTGSSRDLPAEIDRLHTLVESIKAQEIVLITELESLRTRLQTLEGTKEATL